jgi:hypothetical protein
MCRRILQVVLVAVSLVCVLAVFMPWQRLFSLTDEQAVRCLPAKMLALPVFAMCVLGATWAARSSHPSRSYPGRIRRSMPRER